MLKNGKLCYLNLCSGSIDRMFCNALQWSVMCSKIIRIRVSEWIQYIAIYLGLCDIYDIAIHWQYIHKRCHVIWMNRCLKAESSCCLGKILSLFWPQISHKYFQDAVFHFTGNCFSHLNWKLSLAGQFFAAMGVSLCFWRSWQYSNDEYDNHDHHNNTPQGP